MIGNCVHRDVKKRPSFKKIKEILSKQMDSRGIPLDKTNLEMDEELFGKCVKKTKEHWKSLTSLPKSRGIIHGNPQIT